jgi:uncharacterized membrane protein (DUF485 family)
MYLAYNKKNHLLLSIPAVFMTAVCVTYLMVAPVANGGLALPITTGYSIGIVASILSFIWFVLAAKKNKTKTSIISE